MDFMFDKSAAIILNVDNFDVSNVKRMNNTFAQMTKLKTLDLNSFYFTHGVDTPGLFRASNSIETVYAKNQANANLLNSSFQKPAGLTVKIK